RSSSSSGSGTMKTDSQRGHLTFLPGVNGLAGLSVASHSGQVTLAMIDSTIRKPIPCNGWAFSCSNQSLQHRISFVGLPPDADGRALAENADIDSPLHLPPQWPDGPFEHSLRADQQHHPAARLQDAIVLPRQSLIQRPDL